MLETRDVSTDAETERCDQLTSGFLILAEKELSAFIRAVDRLFGAARARQSALDWIEQLGRMDWPSGESIPDWRRATVARKCSAWRFVVRQWTSRHARFETSVFVTSRSSFSRSRELSEWSSIIEEVLIRGSGITER